MESVIVVVTGVLLLELSYSAKFETLSFNVNKTVGK